MANLFADMFIKDNKDNFKMFINGEEHKLCSYIYKKDLNISGDILEINTNKKFFKFIVYVFWLFRIIFYFRNFKFSN